MILHPEIMVASRSKIGISRNKSNFSLNAKTRANKELKQEIIKNIA
jgi:hypothetical protein